MKQLLQTILIAIVVMASGMSAVAQPNNSNRISREKLAVKQANYIADQLAFDKATTDKYVETYCQYQQEVWALGSRKNLNTEQRLERSQQILDLRKKYNNIYLGFLTERQLDKAYKLEKRLTDRMVHNKPKVNNKSKGNHKTRK